MKSIKLTELKYFKSYLHTYKVLHKKLKKNFHLKTLRQILNFKLKTRMKIVFI